VVVELLVEDNGGGMGEANVDDLFAPFYTAKGANGTGLGLSVSYGIVKSYGGDIELLDRENGGVRARVFLPYKMEDTDG
jgi:signal transduction histidine kinase